MSLITTTSVKRPTYFSAFQFSSSAIMQWHLGAHSSRKMMMLVANSRHQGQNDTKKSIQYPIILATSDTSTQYQCRYCFAAQQRIDLKRIYNIIIQWRSGVVVSGVGLINEVNRHRARLVLGWVTVCGAAGKPSWYVTKSPWSTQPSIPPGQVNRVRLG